MANTPERITFYLKNMVSSSCIKLVKNVLSNLKQVVVIKVELGIAVIEVENIDNFKQIEVEKKLKDLDFPVINDKNLQLVEQIKIACIELIHYYNNANSLIRNSDYLCDKLGFPYHHLTKLFSDKTGLTLEKYIILLKIERIKELLIYDEHSLSEISFMMGYSSVQYLSNQFKQIAGVTISDFKKNKNYTRIPLEDLA